MSVVIANGKTRVIAKGAIEEMPAVCTYAEYEGKAEPLTDEIKEYILKKRTTRTMTVCASLLWRIKMIRLRWERFR